jgi:hypothetical protein
MYYKYHYKYLKQIFLDLPKLLCNPLLQQFLTERLQAIFYIKALLFASKFIIVSSQNIPNFISISYLKLCHV